MFNSAEVFLLTRFSWFHSHQVFRRLFSIMNNHLKADIVGRQDLFRLHKKNSIFLHQWILIAFYHFLSTCGYQIVTIFGLNTRNPTAFLHCVPHCSSPFFCCLGNVVFLCGS